VGSQDSQLYGLAGAGEDGHLPLEEVLATGVLGLALRLGYIKGVC
jgi:hypothetical protein